MQYKVKFLPSLSRDIHRIAEALVEYPDKARRLLKEMDENLLRLEDMPLMWPVFHARPKYRKMVLEDHLLFYTVDEQKREVRACRIFYFKMDVARHLKN
jgi:plasmid stabilization system protein ParE